MLRLTLVLAVCVVQTLAQVGYDVTLDQYWSMYKIKFNKEYASAAEDYGRRLVWEDNLRYIQSHNLEADLGKHTFRLGLNQHSDLKHSEYMMLLGFKGIRSGMHRNNTKFRFVPNMKLPTAVDWRDQGIVTPVKNQGQCGSCWAFSTTGSLEGQHAKKTGNLVSLSEQNLVDCAKACDGCGGGWVDKAFEYIIKNGGIDTEDSYPYKGQDGRCKYDPNSVGATCTSYKDIPQGDEASLKQAAANIGPISVAIDASHRSFQSYQSGVYIEQACSTQDLDHAVLVVGYGTEDGQDYWLVKNSWGEVWGMQGYIKMARNYNNQCGIATAASYPIV